jgi:hypothetical protein
MHRTVIIMKATKLTCLFVSKQGALAVHLLEAPLPAEQHIPSVSPGVKHPCRVVGGGPLRLFKRTVEGEIPVYEEV